MLISTPQPPSQRPCSFGGRAVPKEVFGTAVEALYYFPCFQMLPFSSPMLPFSGTRALSLRRVHRETSLDVRKDW